VGLTEELLELGVREPQLRDAELCELADRPELRNGHGRLTAAREDDRETLWSPRHDLAGDVADVGDLVGQVEVVEDQRGPFGRDRLELAAAGLHRIAQGGRATRAR